MSYSATLLLSRPYFLLTRTAAAAATSSFPQRARVAGSAGSATATRALFSSIPASTVANGTAPAAQRRNSSSRSGSKIHCQYPKSATSNKILSISTSTSMTTTATKRTLSSSSSSNSFLAWRVEETGDGSFVGSEQKLSLSSSGDKDDDDNDDNDNDNDNETTTVLIRVTHSSLNYKDALSASGNKGVTRKFPHTPGIDAAGIIVSENDDDNNNASALVTGYDLGMNTDGGFGEFIRVPSEWIVTPNPFAASENEHVAAARTCMVYGTAGLTAALSVQKLLAAGNAKPSDGKVLVTGATGGVGSIAVELLAKLGFEVVALTGKQSDGESEAFLLELGASEVVDREALAPSKKPILRPLYAHAIDTVGGSPLAELLKQIRHGGSVTACGNAAGMALETNVLPFILRGVQLLGVDSVQISLPEKTRIWKKLSGEWRCPKAEALARDIGRDELDGCLKTILEGKASGRKVLVHGLVVSTGGGRSKL